MGFRQRLSLVQEYRRNRAWKQSHKTSLCYQCCFHFKIPFIYLFTVHGPGHIHAAVRVCVRARAEVGFSFYRVGHRPNSGCQA